MEDIKFPTVSTITRDNLVSDSAAVSTASAVLDVIGCGLFVLNSENRFIDCSEFFAQSIFGLPRGNVVGRTISELELLSRSDEALLNGEFSDWLMTPEKSKIDSINIRGADKLVRKFSIACAASLSDTGERTIVGAIKYTVQAEGRPLSSVDRIFRAFENSILGFGFLDLDDKIEFCNNSFARIFGFESASSLIGRSILSFVPLQEIPKVEQQNAQRRTGESAVYELNIQTASGDKRTIQTSVSPHFDHNGSFVGSNVGLLDITDQVNLREQLMLLAKAVDSCAEAIVLTDREAKIKYVNPAFERVSGYSIEQALGKSTSILNSGRHDADFYRDLWDTILSGRTWRGRLINRNSAGDLYYEDGSIAPVCGNTGEITHFVAVKRDITNELELESQLLQSQKMENLALLAGGIAHDFNNLLAVIQGHVFLATEHLDKRTESSNELDQVMDLCKRGSRLTKSLLAFTRQKENLPATIDASEAIKEMADLLTYIAGKSNTLVIDAFGEVCPVKIVPSYLDQIMTNLVINSRDAFGQKAGKITITVRSGSPTTEYPDGVIRLSVTDDGPGIPEQLVSKIFAPFFTTKDVGKGTGLGLSTVKKLVESAGGRISVDTKVGVGTKMEMSLPRAH